MRRRPHARPRPALPQRAIVAFPDPASPANEAFRAAHDPLAGRIAAHVTLVFPFASSLSDMQVLAHMRRMVRRWPTLPVTLSGVAAYDARWVHVRVTRGSAAVIELHDRLYRGALAPFLRREFAYQPHVTLARADDAHGCEAMLATARDALRSPIAAVLRELVLVRITRAGIDHVAVVALAA